MNRLTLIRFYVVHLLLVFIGLLLLSIHVKYEVPTQEPYWTSTSEKHETFEIFPVDEGPSRQADEYQTETKKPYSNSTKEPFMKPEWVTALVTLAYTVVSFFALLAIRRQAKDAVLVERAWIDIHLKTYGVNNYSLYATNHGRTIAKVNSWSVATSVVSFHGHLENPPDCPNEMTSRSGINRIVGPSAEQFLETMYIYDSFRDEWGEIVALTKRPYFFIRIVYEDTTGKTHTTDACFTYSLNQTFVDMPEKRKYT